MALREHWGRLRCAGKAPPPAQAPHSQSGSQPAPLILVSSPTRGHPAYPVLWESPKDCPILLWPALCPVSSPSFEPGVSASAPLGHIEKPSRVVPAPCPSPSPAQFPGPHTCQEQSLLVWLDNHRRDCAEMCSSSMMLFVDPCLRGLGGLEEHCESPLALRREQSSVPSPCCLSFGDCLALGEGVGPPGASNYGFRGTDLITASRRVNYY